MQYVRVYPHERMAARTTTTVGTSYFLEAMYERRFPKSSGRQGLAVSYIKYRCSYGILSLFSFRGVLERLCFRDVGSPTYM